MSKGYFQVGGCLKNALLSEKAQHPIILPKNHHGSKLVVRQANKFQSGHSGKEYVLSLIRQKLWIVGARPLVKWVLKECVVCRRLRGKSGVQRMANLPTKRVTPRNHFHMWVLTVFWPFHGEEGLESSQAELLLIYLSYYASCPH